MIFSDKWGIVASAAREGTEPRLLVLQKILYESWGKRGESI